MSEKPTIYEALSRVMAEVQAVRKRDRNQQQGYSFRGIDAVVNAVGPALREHGVIVVPHVQDVHYNTVEVGQKRTPMRECTVKVRYVFHGPAGDTIDCLSVGEAMDSGDKSTPKAMSVAMRVALLQALCIPTDEPDADATAYERAPARDRWEQAEKPPTPEQVQAYELILAELGDVTRRVDIGRVGKKATAARNKGDITPAQFHALDLKAGERIAELQRLEQDAAALSVPDPQGEQAAREVGL